MRLSRFVLSLALLGPAAAPLAAQSVVDSRLVQALRWRNVGPFRGGRVGAVTGVIGEPGTFYAGFPGGGVWKTTSAGQVWEPIFDSVKEVSSVGAVEVAPSNANVVYVGTGDMITGGTLDRGNGVWKSTDAGKTWSHMGLDGTQHIQSMVVDPQDPNTLLVGALGDALHESTQRGVFRSTDGGRSWQQTLFVDGQTGIARLSRAYDRPDVIYATTMKHYAPPAYNQDRLRTPQLGLGATVDTVHRTRIYRSTDGGRTWSEVQGSGLPRLDGRTAIAVAQGTNAQRLYLITNTGLWRSDDAGASWRQMAADDERIRNGQGGYSCGVYVDPKNPDVVYTFNTAAYKSTDGGKTFTGIKGAPGGDDPQQAWIDPTDGRRILFGYDQGLTVSLDGGAHWSSWYNQSTEQIYHIAADNSFPYWIYGTQQDAGAIRTRSRGNYGAITMFDWNSVNGWEWGTIVPNPRNPNEVFASGAGVVRISYPSEQWLNVSPAIDPAAKARGTSSMPLIWAPWNPAMLIVGLNFVATTTDGGAHWTKISGELGIPAGLDSTAAANLTGGRGAIESLAASSVQPGVIWAGTSNGLIHLTRDGGQHWADVSVPDLPIPRRANISAIDASHFDAGTAYVAIEYLRGGDHTPYIFRTKDFGKHWERITDGLPTGEAGGSFVRVVREDPKRRGLLFAGTESSVHVSFDDGAHWQPLTNNLPNSPVRDLLIKDNDLVAATHGRGIWILDDISMLRQLTPKSAESVQLFAPGRAVRMRRNVNADTPLPPEIPHAENSADGAILDYWLPSRPSAPITLVVKDATGRVVRQLSSASVEQVAEFAKPPHPNFWVLRESGIPADAGANRTHWDLRADPPHVFSHSYEISANPGLTPPSPEGMMVAAGTYTLALTVDGKTVTQSVAVANDPRVTITAAGAAAQDSLLRAISTGIEASWTGYQQADALRRALGSTPANAPAPLAEAMNRFRASVDSIAGGEGGRRFGGGGGTPSLRALNGTFAGLLTAQDNADFAPNPPMRAAYAAACKDLAAAQARLMALVSAQLPALNAALTGAGKSALVPPVSAPPVRCVMR